jgi:hypothetical protein
MCNLIAIAGFVAVGLCSSCASPRIDFEEVRTRAVQRQTVLPQTFSSYQKNLGERAPIVVPREFVYLQVISRPVAELREGPGHHFAIKDRLIDRGTEVIVLDEVGVWKKILVATDNEVGWVHQQTMSDLDLISGNIILNPKLLPVVIAIRPITSVYQIEDLKPKRVKIDKGTLFISLKEKLGRRLLWISETNSVAWVDSKDLG